MFCVRTNAVVVYVVQESKQNEKRALSWMTHLQRLLSFVVERRWAADWLVRECGEINNSAVFTGVTQMTAHKTEFMPTRMSGAR
jgi:hypothetical protein